MFAKFIHEPFASAPISAPLIKWDSIELGAKPKTGCVLFTRDLFKLLHQQPSELFFAVVFQYGDPPGMEESIILEDAAGCDRLFRVVNHQMNCLRVVPVSVREGEPLLDRKDLFPYIKCIGQVVGCPIEPFVLLSDSLESILILRIRMIFCKTANGRPVSACIAIQHIKRAG